MATAGGAGQPLLFHLADKALHEAGSNGSYWAVQRHHPDGHRWLEVGRFATKKIAQVTLEALVAHGQGNAGDFRVKRVSLPEGSA